MGAGLEELVSAAQSQNMEFDEAAAEVEAALKDGIEKIIATSFKVEAAATGKGVVLRAGYKGGKRTVFLRVPKKLLQIVPEPLWEWGDLAMEQASITTKCEALALVPKLLRKIAKEQREAIKRMKKAAAKGAAP